MGHYFLDILFNFSEFVGHGSARIKAEESEVQPQVFTSKQFRIETPVSEGTICPRICDPFYIITYHIKMGHYFLPCVQEVVTHFI